MEGWRGRRRRLHNGAACLPQNNQVTLPIARLQIIGIALELEGLQYFTVKLFAVVRHVIEQGFLITQPERNRVGQAGPCAQYLNPQRILQVHITRYFGTRPDEGQVAAPDIP